MKPTPSAWKAGIGLALLSLPAMAQTAPSGALASFDIRLESGRPRAEVLLDLALARTEAQRNARAEDYASLARDIPALAMQDDALFGTPHFLRSTRALLTRSAPGREPLSVVRGFLAEHADLFEVPATEVDIARVSRDFLTRHNGVTHLSLQQQARGLDLWGAELKASVTADGRLINISSTLLPRPAGGFALPPISVTPAEALRLAAANVSVELGALVSLTEPAGRSAPETWDAGAALRADVPVTTSLLAFPLSRTRIVPAWAVVLPVHGVGDTFELLVDASTGEVLHRWNRLRYAAPAPMRGDEDVTYRVYTGDSPQPASPGLAGPTGQQFPIVPRELVTVDAASIAGASPEGWIPDGLNETLGNNVDAHTDLDGDDVADLPRPTGSPYRVFDFALDLAQPPTSYTDAAVVNLFYLCNLYHDRIHAFGFDEAAGNFQNDNFGAGGLGGDRMQVDSLDGSGVDNANFSSGGVDGTSARIQMFAWVGPDPDRSGGLDSEIVYHEYTHGLTTRLHAGTLFGGQASGMAEGWSDFFGICMNAEPTDDPNAVYAMGAYVTYLLSGGTDNYYFGIRRYPYTTDLERSPLTYADVDPAQLVHPPGIPTNPAISMTGSIPHNAGEIWCNALLACRAELWSGMGFAANDVLMQLVVDGMKLSPASPNMLESRDAILQADLVNNAGANTGELWAGFAFRGMGDSAVSPSGSQLSGLVEAFDIPTLISIGFPNGVPGQLTPETPSVFTVKLTALGSDQPLQDSGTLSYSVNGGAFATAAMVETTPGLYTASLPGFACFDEVRWYVSVLTTAGTLSDPITAPAATHVSVVHTGQLVSFQDDLEQDLGWTGGLPGDTAATGVWERVDPVGTAAQPETDATPGAGTLCWITGQGFVGGGLGDNDVDAGFTTLLTPVFSTPGPNTVVSYERWFSNDLGTNPFSDVFVVDISNDGGSTWTNVEVVGPAGEGTTGGWVHHEFVVGSLLPPTSTMRLRFVAEDDPSDGQGALVEAAIDDFEVRQLLCAVCQPDAGFQGPGTSVLSVCGTTLDAGGTAAVHLAGGPANAPAVLIIGNQSNPTGLLGGTVVPVPALATLFLSTDANGEFTLSGLMGGVPATVTLYMQAAVFDFAQPQSFQLSNAVAAQFLP